jgi:hypothetical protein
MDKNEYEINKKAGFIEISLGKMQDGSGYRRFDHNNDQKSVFLYYIVFNSIFWECFQNIKNEAIDPADENHYRKKENLLRFKNLLEGKRTILIGIKTIEEFIEKTTNTFFKPLGSEINTNIFINELNYQEGESWKEKWQLILSKLIEVNKGLIEIIDEAIKKEKVLWIDGDLYTRLKISKNKTIKWSGRMINFS